MIQRKIRRNRGISAAIIFASVVPACAVFGDTLQNAAVNATSSQLFNAGFFYLTPGFPLNVPVPIDGTGVKVGVVEAVGGLANTSNGLLNTTPNSALPNGNPDLPAFKVNLIQLAGGSLPAGGVLPAGVMVRNHGSEVTGVVVGQGIAGPADRGIATGSNVLESGISAGDLDPTNGYAALIQRELQAGTHIINLSLGAAVPQIPANPPGMPLPAQNNNGSSFDSLFNDWAVGQYNALTFVAGNEVNTEVDEPADEFNGITVGATGFRNGAGQLSYDRLANYNVSSNGPGVPANQTSDGRIGVQIVAPGGDPGPSGAVGTFLNPPAFVNQFTSTAGGQYQLNTTIAVGANSTEPVYKNDVFNGLNPAAPFSVTSASTYLATNDSLTQLNPAPPAQPVFPAANPGGFANADRVLPVTSAGTSFATPLVAGTDALLTQFASVAEAANPAFTRNASDAVDHRVLKALILNGGSKFNPDNTPLQYNLGGGLQSWTKAPAIVGGSVTLPAYFNNVTVPLQPGLDQNVGTGELNVMASLTNQAAGEQGPGIVKPIGWDFETYPSGKSLPVVFNYDFNIGANSGFQATLAWDSVVANTDASSGEGMSLWSPASVLVRSPSLTDLDLYLFATNGLEGPIVGAPVSFSTSIVDNVEHVYVPSNLAAGNYELDVLGPSNVTTATPFGLAWTTVPEPTTLCLLALATPLALRRRKRS
jgi:hypothetical protein